MFAVRPVRVQRSLLVAVVLAVTVPVLTVPGVAAADDEVSTGDTVVGEFAQVWPEYENPDEAVEHGDEGPLSFVHTEDGESIRVDTEDVEDLPVGATVSLTVGQEVSDTASAEEGFDEARQVLDAQVLEAAPAPTTAPAAPPYTNSVTVAMIVPAGGTQDGTALADVVAAVNGPVAAFWGESTDGAVRIGVTAQHNWITTTAGCANPFALWSEAASKVNFVAGPGKHLMLYVGNPPPGPSGCSYGLAEVKSGPGAGGNSYVRDVATSVMAHELGHNFGLGHSSARRCDAAVDSGVCETVPYDDLYDVMGASWEQVGSLNVAQASHLVPLDLAEFGPVSAAGTVTLTPVSQRAGKRAIVLRTSDPATSFWLEYRPASGRDAWLGTADNWVGLEAGVLLRRDDSGGGASDSSLLLDASPSPQAGWETDGGVALPVGTPVVVNDRAGSTGAFTVTVRTMSPASATVDIMPTTGIDLAHAASGGDSGPMGPATTSETCGTWAGVTAFCERTYQNGRIYWTPSVGARVIHGLYAAWTASGGLTRWGFPTTHTACGLAGGGCTQSFQKGSSAYWSPGTALVNVSGAIRSYWLGRGGESGPLGYPVGESVCDSRGCDQAFQGGTLVSSVSGGSKAVEGVLHATWTAAGGRTGSLGAPTTAMTCGLVRAGCGQLFERGAVYSSPGTGTHVVKGAILARWRELGAQAGPLGYPVADEEVAPGGGGALTRFEYGVVYWSAETGPRMVRGALLAHYEAAGGPASLGFPIADDGGTADGTGALVRLQRAAIYWSPTTGARTVGGAIRSRWTALGAQAGYLRYPVSDEVCGLPRGGCYQTYQGGTIFWSPASGARSVGGAIRGRWSALGAQDGYLGYPMTDEVCGLRGGGCSQGFQGGTIYWSPASGARSVGGALGGRWGALGAQGGYLGYPLTDEVCGLIRGGCYQAFQGGTIYWSPASGARPVGGGIRSRWGGLGAQDGYLGYPMTDEVCGLRGGGCSQGFQGATIYWSPASGSHPVSGALAAMWGGQGRENGPLGYPVGGPRQLASGDVTQAFERGSLTWSATTGQVRSS